MIPPGGTHAAARLVANAVAIYTHTHTHIYIYIYIYIYISRTSEFVHVLEAKEHFGAEARHLHVTQRAAALAVGVLSGLRNRK